METYPSDVEIARGIILAVIVVAYMFWYAYGKNVINRDEENK